MTTREHLAWAKQRALEYLPSDPVQAVTSFISDLRKHDDLADHAVIELSAMMMFSGLLDAGEARRLIEGSS